MATTDLSFEIPRRNDGVLFSKKVNAEMFDEICDLTPFIIGGRESLKKRIFCIVNDLSEIPKCPECGIDVKWHQTRSFFANHCSNICSANSELVKNKIKDTCTERFGTDNPSKSKQIRQKLSTSISIGKAKKYAEKSICDDGDCVGIVYILYFKHLNAVKIGLSTDFNVRKKSLTKDFGEFSVIKLIETLECKKLEDEFHERFEEYRICFSKGHGRTEFFKEEILQLL